MLIVAWVVSLKVVFAVIKTTKSMNHLGAMALIGSSSGFYGGESHPGLKRLIDVHVKGLPSTATCQWALA
jgi:hypothetical protein